MGKVVEQMKSFFGFESIVGSEKQSRVRDRLPNKLPIATSGNIYIESPQVYEDSLDIAAHLRHGSPVIVNLNDLDSDTGKRLIDFICGTVYALNGHMIKISDATFLFTPEHVVINSKPKKTKPVNKALLLFLI